MDLDYDFLVKLGRAESKLIKLGWDWQKIMYLWRDAAERCPKRREEYRYAMEEIWDYIQLRGE